MLAFHAVVKSALAKPAPKKTAPTKPVAAKPEAQKVVYCATGRGGVERRSTSATVLSHAVDVKISGRKGAHAAGCVVAFYSSEAAASKAAASVNAGEAGPDWSDAIVVAVRVASAKVAS